MKKLFLFICFLPCLTFAELRLRSPGELVREAQESRESFFGVLREIDMNIPEMRNREDGEKYLFILPELEQIGKNLSAKEISGQAFELTASTLTQQALRWFRFESDSETTMKAYFRYAKEGAIATAINQASSLWPFITQPIEAMRFVSNLEVLQKWVEEKQLPLYLRLQLQELRSTAALRELRNFGQLSEADQDFWFRQLSPTTGISAFLFQIHNWSLNESNSKNPATLSRVRNLLAKIQQRLQATPELVPQTVLDSFNDAVVSVLNRSIDQSDAINEDQITAFVDALSPRHLMALAWHFRDPQFAPSAEYAPQYIKIAQKVEGVMIQKGLIQGAKDLSRRIQELSGNAKAKENSLEGTYRVVFKNGAVFILNIAFVSADKMVIGLGDHSYGNFVYFAFYNIEYSVEKDTYIASEREKSDELIRNRVIKFKTDGDRISGSLEGTPMKYKTFSGKKTEEYHDFMSDSRGVAGSPDGDYEGVAQCKGFSKKIKVHVDTVLGVQSGIATLGNQESFLELRHGLKDARRNIVYLTSSAYPNRSFVQIRGLIDKDIFYGQFIVGGVGILCPNMTLKKVRSEQ